MFPVSAAPTFSPWAPPTWSQFSRSPSREPSREPVARVVAFGGANSAMQPTRRPNLQSGVFDSSVPRESGQHAASLQDLQSFVQELALSLKGFERRVDQSLADQAKEIDEQRNSHSCSLRQLQEALSRQIVELGSSVGETRGRLERLVDSSHGRPIVSGAEEALERHRLNEFMERLDQECSSCDVRHKYMQDSVLNSHEICINTIHAAVKKEREASDKRFTSLEQLASSSATEARDRDAALSRFGAEAQNLYEHVQRVEGLAAQNSTTQSGAFTQNCNSGCAAVLAEERNQMADHLQHVEAELRKVGDICVSQCAREASIRETSLGDLRSHLEETRQAIERRLESSVTTVRATHDRIEEIYGRFGLCEKGQSELRIVYDQFAKERTAQNAMIIDCIDSLQSVRAQETTLEELKRKHSAFEARLNGFEEATGRASDEIRLGSGIDECSKQTMSNTEDDQCLQERLDAIEKVSERLRLVEELVQESQTSASSLQCEEVHEASSHMLDQADSDDGEIASPLSAECEVGGTFVLATGKIEDTSVRSVSTKKVTMDVNLPDERQYAPSSSESNSSEDDDDICSPLMSISAGTTRATAAASLSRASMRMSFINKIAAKRVSLSITPEGESFHESEFEDSVEPVVKTLTNGDRKLSVAIQRSSSGPVSVGPSFTLTGNDDAVEEPEGTHSMIGLPRVNIFGVDSQNGCSGKHFFFQPQEWSDMVGVTSHKMWKGHSYHCVQMRGGTRIWSGYITVDRSGSKSYGKRSSREAYGQWQVDDIILQGGDDASYLWMVEDTILLGTEDVMFDETILRLDGNQYASVIAAVDALNSGAVSCSVGICIMYSSNENEYCLLVRTDKKAEGMRVYWEVTEQADDADLETQFDIGQRVKVDNHSGYVRYTGHTEFALGSWVGVELDRDVGKNSGSIEGVSYFSCQPNHGIFVRPGGVSIPQAVDQWAWQKDDDVSGR